ncbi:MAG: glycoside hydrolase family 95 protein [Planctomycetaceae bacterium]|nr:glycoside hydrolase family 95 protein [Planctomycetaceae bacterium]
MSKTDASCETRIVLDHPTPLWFEGLPLGNGDMGVVVHGSPEQVTLGFNKSHVWDYRISPGQGLPEDKTTFNELVTRAGAGDWAWCDTIYKDWLDRENSSGPSLQPCGQLDLNLLPGERSLSFRQELDLETAMSRVHCPCTEYREHRQAFTVETLVPARDKVIPVTLSNVPDKKLFGKARLWRQHSLDCPCPRAWVSGDIAGIDMSIPESIDYTLAVRALGGQCSWEASASEVVLNIAPSFGRVVLLVTIVSSKEEPDTRAAAVARLRKTDEETPASLEGPHRAWWRRFWAASSVSVPDAALQKGWRWGMYLFGSSSQPGHQAPGLQGIWNLYNRPAWHTDYHADGNVEILHQCAYTNNHLELLEPLYRLYAVEMRDETRRAAKEYFNRRGLYVPMAGGPHGHELAAPWAWPGAGAWVAQYFWWHYLYSQDVEFLRWAYPFLKELSLFYEDFLSKNDRGLYDLGPSFSPEMIDWRAWLMMCWGKNVTMDLAMLRVLLTALIESSRVLGVDEADRARWSEILDHLPPYPEKLGYWLDVENEEYLVLEPSIPRIGPLWPAGEVDVASPQSVQQVAWNTFKRIRGHYDGGNHCSIWLACAAAQLGKAGDAIASIHKCTDHRRDNGMSDIMQLDPCYGTAAAVAHLLLQSLKGVIRVFPAVPDAWRDVSFTTLRAVGAFLVSAQRESGKTTRVCIDSEKGGLCVVADPFGAGRAVLSSSGKNVELTTDADGCFRFETQFGQSYSVTPSGGSK